MHRPRTSPDRRSQLHMNNLRFHDAAPYRQRPQPPSPPHSHPRSHETGIPFRATGTRLRRRRGDAGTRGPRGGQITGQTRTRCLGAAPCTASAPRVPSKTSPNSQSGQILKPLLLKWHSSRDRPARPGPARPGTHCPAKTGVPGGQKFLPGPARPGRAPAATGDRWVLGAPVTGPRPGSTAGARPATLPRPGTGHRSGIPGARLGARPGTPVSGRVPGRSPGTHRARPGNKNASHRTL